MERWREAPKTEEGEGHKQQDFLVTLSFRRPSCWLLWEHFQEVSLKEHSCPREELLLREHMELREQGQGAGVRSVHDQISEKYERYGWRLCMAGSLNKIPIRHSLSDFIMKSYDIYTSKYSTMWCQKVCCMVLNRSSSCFLMVSQVFFCLKLPKFFLWTLDFIEIYQALSSCLLHLYSVSSVSDLNLLPILWLSLCIFCFLEIFTIESKATVIFFFQGSHHKPFWIM